MSLPLNIFLILGLILLVGAAVLVVRMIKNRLDEQRYQEHLAELKFEANVLNGLHSPALAGASDAVFLQQDPILSASSTLPASTALHAPDGSITSMNAAHTDSSAPADTAAKPITDKLASAGMLGGIEGFVEVHGNPKGAAIVRLRTGKLALVVPHMESEAFLRRNYRRVDMIIMMGSDGGAYVVRRLEDLIADSITIQ